VQAFRDARVWSASEKPVLFRDVFFTSEYLFFHGGCGALAREGRRGLGISDNFRPDFYWRNHHFSSEGGDVSLTRSIVSIGVLSVLGPAEGAIFLVV
jgi:hypothetical protein